MQDNGRRARRERPRGLAGLPRTARSALGRERDELRALVGRGAGRRPVPVRPRRQRAPPPAAGEHPPGLARPGRRGRSRSALRLPGARRLRPRLGAALQPGQAAAGPLRPGGRRRADAAPRAVRPPRRRGRLRHPGHRRTRRRTCRAGSWCTTRSRGTATAPRARRGRTPSSTRCTCAGRRCATPTSPRRCAAPTRAWPTRRSSSTCGPSASPRSSCCRCTTSSASRTCCGAG